MTVADLIEVLQQCPNPKMEVKVRVMVDGTWPAHLPIEEVHEALGIVVIEIE